MLKTVNLPEKPIISNGPRDEIQMDLWYLLPDIKNICEYKYVIDIVDHFSKWIWSYPVKSKTSEEALKCLKSYIFSYGIFYYLIYFYIYIYNIP